MIGNLLKSEFRKIFSVKMWWGLLIPSAAVAFLANLGFSQVNNSFHSVEGMSVPVALISLGLSFTFTSIFASIFGSLAVSGEFRHKTITTTYLTSGSRGASLTTKLIAYTVMGLVYGVITLAFATLGALAGAGTGGFPSATSWLMVSGLGVLVITLWTLLGVGLGALLSNQVAVVVTLLAYGIAGESILAALFHAANAPQITNYLPVHAANDSVIGLAIQRFLDEFSAPSSSAASDVQGVFNAFDLPQWWISALIFIAYAVVIGALGWAVGRQRDIT